MPSVGHAFDFCILLTALPGPELDALPIQHDDSTSTSHEVLELGKVHSRFVLSNTLSTHCAMISYNQASSLNLLEC